MLAIWSAMATFVPFVVVGVAARPAMMPIVVAFVMLGLVSARRPTTTASS
jgi:hypothetical protein